MTMPCTTTLHYYDVTLPYTARPADRLLYVSDDCMLPIIMFVWLAGWLATTACLLYSHSLAHFTTVSHRLCLIYKFNLFSFNMTKIKQLNKKNSSMML